MNGFLYKNLVLFGTLCLFLLAACSNDTEDNASEEEYKSAEAIYSESYDLLKERQYKQAAESFDEVERVHPYSEWAPRSQIMGAYAHYKARNYDDTILTLERFIKLHPGHDSADYAYYLIALSYYEQISDVGRDQGMTRDAMSALRDVVRRYPDTDYARDAKLKMDLTLDHLAGKEMMIGRYYQDKQEYLAAANRFRTVLEQYDTTSHAAEALHRLVEIYLELGVPQQAQEYAAVLGHNYPNSPWYKRSYALLQDTPNALPQQAQDDSWWNLF